MDYYQKYIKYKEKYIQLKNMIGSGPAGKEIGLSEIDKYLLIDMVTDGNFNDRNNKNIFITDLFPYPPSIKDKKYYLDKFKKFFTERLSEKLQKSTITEYKDKKNNKDKWLENIIIKNLSYTDENSYKKFIAEITTKIIDFKTGDIKELKISIAELFNILNKFGTNNNTFGTAKLSDLGYSNIFEKKK